jgi:hypothetical protein
MIGPEYSEVLDCAKSLISGKDGDETWIKLNKFLREG